MTETIAIIAGLFAAAFTLAFVVILHGTFKAVKERRPQDWGMGAIVSACLFIIAALLWAVVWWAA